jgi:hypothetical protein
MKSSRLAWLLPLALPLALPLVACTSTGPVPGDVVGPFTGPTQRYVIDAIRVPINSIDARLLADDLDGDGVADNQAGMAAATLSLWRDTTDHGADMIASGVIASSVELQADDLTDDPTVGVRFFGADGAEATVMGGRLSGGAFAANRVRTSGVPGAGVVVLPVLADADPLHVAADALQLDLTPDGHGGFDGVLAGSLSPDDAQAAVATALIEMIRNRPGDHAALMHDVDTNLDGVVSDAEARGYSLLRALLAPDLWLRDGRAGLSFGVAIHLSPCASGRCHPAPPADTCGDRILDGDETAVDCGGGCGPCSSGATCKVATDCDARSCSGTGTGTGTCAAPRCDDHLQDGFEQGVDCGGPYCAACPGM